MPQHATSATFRILFCALLATAIGQSVMLTTLPSMGREAGLSEFHIAIIMSSSAFIFALGTSVWSKVAKRAGFKRILMVGLFGYSVGTFFFASAWQMGFSGLVTGTSLFLALLISRSMQSTIMSATPPSAVGYAIAISTQQERVSAISKVTSASNVGQIVGPAYAGLLVGFGLLTPLYSIVILTLTALVLVWVKLPAIAPSAVAENNITLNKKPVHHSMVPLLLVASCAGVFCAMAMMQQTLGFFFIDFYGKTTVEAAQQVGTAMMVSAVASLGVQLFLVQRARFSPEKMIKVALPLLAVAYMLMYAHQQISTLYIAMFCMGIGMGMAYPSLTATATSYCTEEKQASITGLITATPAMGYIVGPPLAATLYQFDISSPFLAASILISAFTILVTVTLMNTNRATKE
jgi:DHA1 family multidrug resistance protein-like MFS transporter